MINIEAIEELKAKNQKLQEENKKLRTEKELLLTVGTEYLLEALDLRKERNELKKKIEGLEFQNGILAKGSLKHFEIEELPDQDQKRL